MKEAEDHPHRWAAAQFILALSVCYILEVFDFRRNPIWGTFDAHALWHLVTIPLVRIWYLFSRGALLLQGSQILGKEAMKNIFAELNISPGTNAHNDEGAKGRQGRAPQRKGAQEEMRELLRGQA